MEILRDQFLDHMTEGVSARPLFCELFGTLVGLEDEWRAQGASADEISLRAFGFDTVRQHLVNADVQTGPFSGITPALLEETAEHQIWRDRLGRRTMLYKSAATIPLPLDHPVQDMDSWLRIKPWYQWNEARLGKNWAENARAARNAGAVIALSIPGGFDEPRQLMGEEAVCMACYENPELLHDILDTIADTQERMIDRVTGVAPVDLLFVHEDLAGKSGPLLGPAQVNEFIAPYYQRAWRLAASRGARLFQQDSDGNIGPVIDAFLAAGINCMYPMEPSAGMDIVAVRKKYGPRLSLMGGIDKHILRRTKDEIRRELEYKLQPMMRPGTVFGLDHRIPNGTPLENYRYYVKTAREILGLESNPAPGWARVAF